MSYKSDARFQHIKVRPKSKFAKKSFRTIALGGNKRMIVGCPKGNWDGSRCGAGMKGVAILRPKYRNGSSSVKRKRKSKYTVANAPRRVRLLWLKKAQKMRKYYAGCRAKLGISAPSRRRAASVTVSRPVIEAVPIGRTAAAYSRPQARLMAPVDGGSYGYGYANPGSVYIKKKNQYGEYEVIHKDGGKKNTYHTNDFSDAMGTADDQIRRYSATDARAAWTRQRKSNPGWNIKPGDKVSFVDRFNKVRSGRAVMRSSYGGWVLNTGGRHGTPAIADDSNITKVSSGRARARNPELLVVSNPDRRNAMRRRRRRNSWRGNRKGHRAAALKGWRKRRHGGSRRKGSRRKGSRRSRKGSRRKGSRRSKHFRTFKAAVKRLGVKKGVRAWKASKYYKRKKR